MKPCPCFSSKPYAECCRPYHEGLLPEEALKLMRSRYSAYALGLAEYIIQTTHPDHPSYSSETSLWKQDILKFSNSTLFVSLTILDFIPGDKKAYVTFKAGLKQNDQDVSFTEKSFFLKEGARWLYRQGEILSP